MDRESNAASSNAGKGILDKEISRRNALHGIGAAAAFCAIGRPAMPTSIDEILTGNHPADRLTVNPVKSIPSFAVDLPVPPVMAPYSTDNGINTYNMEIKEGSADIITGLVPGAGATPIMGYAPAGGEATFPGPTIKARSNKRSVVTHYNHLAQEAVVHLHGGVNESRSDGHPADIIPANTGSRVYQYDNKQAAATLWYHEHCHGNTASGVQAGLAAMYLIGDDVEDSLNLPTGDYDIPLFVADRAFADDGRFFYPGALSYYDGQGWQGGGGQSVPTANLVNGAPMPRKQVQRRRYRFRILNGSNTRRYIFELSNGASFVQIGSDVGLLPKPIERTTIDLSPAERAEVVIDFSSYTAGTEIRLVNAHREGLALTQDVMRFDVVSGGGPEDFEVRDTLGEPIVIPKPVTQRTFELDKGPTNGQFAFTPTEWQINGRGYDDHRIDVRPRLGTSEIWHWVNKSGFYHPMHMHLGHFQVLSRGGKKAPAYERGWKDTVLVEAGETVSVLAYFGGFSGRYVYHCHALEHGDINMMGQMEVVI